MCRQQFPLTAKVCPRHQLALLPVERPTDPAGHASRTILEDGLLDDPSDLVTDLERRSVASQTPSVPTEKAVRGVDRTMLEPAYQPKSGEGVARPREAPTVPAGVAAVEPPTIPGPTTSVVGQVYDGYITTAVLAEGGMGVVYEAQHPLLGTQAVVKVLKKLLKGDPVSKRRMLTEGQTLSALVHRNVVRVFGFGHLADGRPWLLMERLVGESLFAAIKGNGAFPVDEALPLMNQMAAGLEATHALGVVHRDLKPDNIFVTVESDGERLIKLIDFGIARPDRAAEPGERDLKTVVGHFVGTISYGAPELFLGSPCSKATDIYALGCVFFELLTGRRVFVPQAPHEVVKMHLEEEPPRVRSLAPTVPQAIDDLVASMLEKKPDDRPTIEAVRAVLKPERLSVAALAPVRSSTPVWVWPLLAAFVGVSVALVWKLLRG
ncbi:MAG: serine/threonine protein kinase [Archangium sp.]|nr:serine/threonine protein kinase [Archangium sp.]